MRNSIIQNSLLHCKIIWADESEASMAQRHEKALEITQAAGAEALLAASPSTVAWLTGFAGDIQTGPNPFAMPPFALLTSDSLPILIASEDDVQNAPPGCLTITFPGFTTEPLRLVDNALYALRQAVGGRKVAIEAGTFPVALAPDFIWVDISAELALARAVKDPDEITKLRDALALCDKGQQEVRHCIKEGLTELDVWARVKAAIEREAGERIPVLVDLLSGPRTDLVGKPPSSRRIRQDDLILTDLAPRRAGYWGDSCTTIAVGEPDAPTKARYRLIRDVLERATEAIRPGVIASELDTMVRASLHYPHHTGHGLGTSYHEEPRIVPGSSTVLSPNMIIALEPGMYGNGMGIRLERVVLVTDDGCEVLSHYDLDL